MATAVTMLAKPHFHYHCPSCRRVWMERAERYNVPPYQPPMEK